MKVFLAGEPTFKVVYKDDDIFKGAKILQSFAYINNYTENHIIPNCKEFILDSGAFTYRMSKGKPLDIDWVDYTIRYADFINRKEISHFFEIDIDSIIGYENVKKLRKVLEERTGRQCIPVWHFERGKEEFLKMCDNYNYVALGGIAGRNDVKIDEKYFPWFINEAHYRNCKIHALGYTKMEGLKKFKFDSVDSSSWTSGARYGLMYIFTGNSMKQIKKPNGTRAKTYPIAVHNFLEWKKFSDWAEVHL